MIKQSRMRLLILALCLCAAAAGAQTSSQPDDSVGSWQLAPFLGYAQRSPVGRWGETPDRDHHFAGVHLNTPLLRIGRATIFYAPNVVPLLIVTKRGMNNAYGLEDSGAPAYAAGLSPFGFRIGGQRKSGIEMYVEAAAGGLWFSRPIPGPDAKSFNYTVEWGGGVVVPAGKRRLQFGYKRHHISNANTAAWNPGIDGNVFYAGLQWRILNPSGKRRK